MVAAPLRLPNATLTPSSTSSTMPEVDTSLRAKRMLPLVLLMQPPKPGAALPPPME